MSNVLADMFSKRTIFTGDKFQIRITNYSDRSSLNYIVINVVCVLAKVQSDNNTK